MKTIKTLFVIGLILALISCTTERNVNFKKYDEIIKPSEFGDFYGINVDASGSSESGYLRKWRDGGYDLSYVYDSSTSEKYTPLQYEIQILKKNSEEEASRTFGLLKNVALRNKSSTSDPIFINEYDSIIDSGDQNFYAIANLGDVPSAIYFLYRKKHMLFTLRVYYYVVKDHSFIKDLVEPKLIDFENFQL